MDVPGGEAIRLRKDSRMIPEGDRRIVHFHISRTAGTALQGVLNKPPRRYVHVEGVAMAWAMDPQHGPLPEDFTFAVVRHPLDRLVSIWGYHFRPVGGRPVEEFHRWYLNGGGDRGGAPMRVSPGKPWEINIMEPQVHWLDGAFAFLDRVYRFEDLGKMGLTLPKVNDSGRSRHWEEYYMNAEVVKKAEKEYRLDFDTFGYELG